jgi:diguanylate cyclase (GGDEF)-like protein
VLLLRDVSEQRTREGAMLELAYKDPLTGLANRASLNDRLELELDHAQRNGKLVALLFLDLDGLKRTNDELGHDAGDALIRGFGARVKAVVRKGDTVARLAGDEFNVILPELDDMDGAQLVATKILHSLREPLVFEGHAMQIKASIGIALFPTHATTPSDLQRLADEAMYRAKEAGGNRFEVVPANAPVSEQQHAS